MNKKALTKHLVSLLLFGINGIVASNIDLSSYEIVFFRTLIGSILLALLFLLGKGKFNIKENKTDFLFVVLSGIAMGTSWMFLYESYKKIGVSIGALLYYCGPVIVMMLSPVIFKEKLTVTKVTGFVIVLIGVFLINGADAGEKIGIWGLFCGIMSAVTYALMVMANKKSTRIVGMENSVIQLIVSFITVSVFLWFKQGFIINVPGDAWIWILMLGIVNTGIGCYLYFSTLSQLPVQTVAVCGYLEALSAVVFAAILLGEKMSTGQIIGAVCIIGGAMTGELVKIKKQER